MDRKRRRMNDGRVMDKKRKSMRMFFVALQDINQLALTHLTPSICVVIDYSCPRVLVHFCFVSCFF